MYSFRSTAGWDSPPTRGSSRVSLPRISEGYVTKFAPHLALKLIKRGTLTFDQRGILRHHSSSLRSSSLHSHVTLYLKWCDKIKISNLLLPRKSAVVRLAAWTFSRGLRSGSSRALRPTRPHTVGYTGGCNQEEGEIECRERASSTPPLELLTPRGEMRRWEVRVYD